MLLIPRLNTWFSHLYTFYLARGAGVPCFPVSTCLKTYPCAPLPSSSMRLLRDAAKLQKAFARADIGVLVRLRLGREGSVGSPEVNQRLHGLQFGGLQHIQRCGCQDEVGEAAVELLLQVKMVEGLRKVSPVEVSIDAEHLSEDHLANFNKLVRESRSFANPFGLAKVGQLRERGGGDGRIVGVRDSRGIGGEDVVVINLSRDPSLHEGHVLVCGELDRLSSAV